MGEGDKAHGPLSHTFGKAKILGDGIAPAHDLGFQVNREKKKNILRYDKANSPDESTPIGFTCYY